MGSFSRRGFFGLLAGASVAAILPEPTSRTIFLPPRGGWATSRNQLLTIDMIAREAYRVLHQNMAFVSTINRQYDEAFKIDVSNDGGKTFQQMPREATIQIRRPVRFAFAYKPLVIAHG